MTKVTTLLLYPIPSRAEGLARGPGNTLLFTEFASNKIATITTDGVVTESMEFRNSQPTGITAGPGSVAWFLGMGTKVYVTPFPR